MKRAIVIAALMLAFAARAQDAASWWNALAADGLPDVTDGLVAWWKLDGNTDDSSGYGNTGINYGAEVVGGKIGQAYSFNNSENDYIEIPSSSAFKPAEITISAWVFVTAFTRYQKIVVLPYATAGWNPPYVAYSLNTDENNHKKGAWNFAIGGGLTIIEGSGLLATGTWYHIVGTYVSGRQNIYVNGALEGTATYVGSIYYSQSGRLIIGSDGPQCFGEGMTGKIDDVRIYNRALSSNEVATIYNRYK